MSIIDGNSPGNQALIARVKAILVQPKSEWLVIDAEPATVKGLYTGYACILALIPAVCGIFGGLLVSGMVGGLLGSFFGASMVMWTIMGAVVSYVLGLASLYVTALIIDALAPSFDGEKNLIQSLKVAVYSSTAVWVAGVFSLIPVLGGLGLFVGALYSLYLFYLGLPVLKRTPESKALVYTVVVILVAFVLNMIVFGIAANITRMGMVGSALVGANSPAVMSGTVKVPGGSVDLGKLEAASKQMEAAAKQMEASASGKAGGVQPVAAEVLQALLPAGVAGYARGEVSSSSGGAVGLSGSQAEAEYSKGDQSFRLEVTDTGGAAGFAALAGAINVQSNKQTSTGYEKVGKVNGRFTTEEWDNSSRTGKYGVMVADRFMVEARGRGASMDELKGAVSAVNFSALEGLAKS